MLPNGQVVQQVVLGEQGLLQGLKPGALLLDTSSAEPWLTQATGAALAERGVAMVDAPVSGAQWGAQEANLVFMVGGDAADVARVRPLLDLMGRAVLPRGRARCRACDEVHQQPDHLRSPSAPRWKAWSSASATGWTRRRWSTCSTNPPAARGSRKNHIRQRVLSRSFDDPFKLELMLKDIGIALELGREAQLPMPLSALGQQLWRAAALAAGPGASVSELARWVENQSGTPVTPGAARTLRGQRRWTSNNALPISSARCKPRDVPPEAQRIVRLVLLAATGAAVAGAGEDGIAPLRELLLRTRRRGAGHAASSSATVCRPPPRRSSTARCAARSTTATPWRRASTSARR